MNRYELMVLLRQLEGQGESICSTLRMFYGPHLDEDYKVEKADVDAAKLHSLLSQLQVLDAALWELQERSHKEKASREHCGCGGGRSV